MATLQNTTVPDNGYYRVGTSTNKALVSAGTFAGVALAHFGYDAWYNGSTWISGSGPVIQISDTAISFYISPNSGVNAFSVSSVSFSYITIWLGFKASIFAPWGHITIYCN